jgi:hypothetical protein
VLVLALAVAPALEKLTPAKTAGMLISFLGVILLDTGHGIELHSPLLLGDLYTFLSIAGFAFYTVFAKRIAMRYDAVELNTYMVCARRLDGRPGGAASGDPSAMGKRELDRVGGHAGDGADYHGCVLHDLPLGAAVHGAVARGGGQLCSAGGRDPDFSTAGIAQRGLCEKVSESALLRSG